MRIIGEILRPISKLTSFKGPDPLANDQPLGINPQDLSSEQQKQLVIQAYNKLKESFAEFAKPEGNQESPAKTCRELKVAHPNKNSGEVRDSCNDVQ